MKNLKSKNGITLIALIVTIIVLLILAGVTISAVMGENGIANKAKEAKQKTQTESAKEQIRLALAEYELEKLDKTAPEIKDFFEGKDWCKDVEFDEETNQTIITTEDGQKYEIDEKGNVTDDWSKVLVDAEKNPEAYKHKEQNTSEYIAIGTDKKSVNMDLWNPTKRDDGNFALGTNPGSMSYSNSGAYEGGFINGKIIGTVPQYIYDEETESFKPVTEMYATFSYDTDLEIAPVMPDTLKIMDFTFFSSGIKKGPIIPSGVESMIGTFRSSQLVTAPVIPASVKYMTNSGSVKEHGTFAGCIHLTGELIINANPVEYDNLFNKTSIEEGCNLILTGKSDILSLLYATKSEESKIELGPIL